MGYTQALFLLVIGCLFQNGYVWQVIAQDAKHIYLYVALLLPEELGS